MDIEEEEEDPFRLLPDEQVLRILSFVTVGDLSNRVSLVSKRFRRLSLDPSLWRNLVIVHKEHTCEESSRGVDAGEFSFKPSGSRAALALVDRCTQLSTLAVMDRVNASAIVCRALDRNSAYGELKEIQFEMSKSSQTANADKMLETIGTHGKALRTLCLYGNVKMNLSRNPGCLQNLTSLLIRNYYIYGLSDNDYKAVADCCKNLRYFSCQNSATNTDQGLDYLFHGLRESLEGFSMSANASGHTHTDDAFKNISVCGKLTWLSLRFHKRLSVKTLEAILEIPLLRTLILIFAYRYRAAVEILSVRDYVGAFGKAREQLAHLKLWDRMLRGHSLMAIADGFLHFIDKSISRVLEKCEELGDLELTGVEDMTSKSFKKVLAPLDRLVFCDRYGDRWAAMARNSAKEKSMSRISVPGLVLSREIRIYADENCWWESLELRQ